MKYSEQKRVTTPWKLSHQTAVTICKSSKFQENPSLHVEVACANFLMRNGQ